MGPIPGSRPSEWWFPPGCHRTWEIFTKSGSLNKWILALMGCNICRSIYLSIYLSIDLHVYMSRYIYTIVYTSIGNGIIYLYNKPWNVTNQQFGKWDVSGNGDCPWKWLWNDGQNQALNIFNPYHRGLGYGMFKNIHLANCNTSFIPDVVWGCYRYAKVIRWGHHTTGKRSAGVSKIWGATGWIKRVSCLACTSKT